MDAALMNQDRWKCFHKNIIGLSFVLHVHILTCASSLTLLHPSRDVMYSCFHIFGLLMLRFNLNSVSAEHLLGSTHEAKTEEGRNQQRKAETNDTLQIKCPLAETCRYE